MEGKEMITVKALNYCDGDITTIDNYDKAVSDTSTTYRLFHRNLITGIGRIRPSLLKAIGKFYSVKPKELVFLKKTDISEIEQTIPLAEICAHTAHKVFQFWLKLNPEKTLREITRKEYDEIARSIRRLHILLEQMKARCYNPDSQNWRWYGNRGIKVCDEWLDDSDKFVLWALKEGYIYYPDKQKGDQLSIDRIDANGDYCPQNCHWIPHRQNCAKTTKRKGTQRNRLFAQLFPRAIEVHNRYYLNWRKVRDEYMDGDTERLVKFLNDNDYTSMAIWRIRKSLEDNNKVEG